jgi:SAM-dependent methyltransferase
MTHAMPIPEPLLALKPGQAGRVLLPEVVALAEREGILGVIRSLPSFTFDKLCDALSRECALDLGDESRRRMVRLLVDLLREVRWLRRSGDGDGWEFHAGRPVLPGAMADAGSDGEIRFLRRCLELAPRYLRGQEPSIGFDPACASLWEDFLGCAEFQACRTVLLDMMAGVASTDARMLDLCHGPGWGIERTLERFPSARLSAIDFTDSFAETARRREAEAHARIRARGADTRPVEWYGPADWRGFGEPLPFGDSSFDAILFGCGDPYIPSRLREDVYADLHRVLAPGGMLGILTRGRPDPERRHVPSRMFRITTLIHDFSESVCAGWQGFADVGESRRLFERIGFIPCGPKIGEMAFFGSSIWLMRKG